MANQGSVSIKIDLDNTDVNKKVSESEKKIEDLGDTAKKSLDGADFDDMAKSASKASGDLDDLKQSAQQSGKEIEGLGDGMERLPEQTKPASDGFTVFKGILADLGSSVIQTVAGKVVGLAGNLFDLIDATSEYSTMQAKVAGSASTFGYSVEFAKEQYAEFYKYVSDDQMATNAITNLMGMKVSTDTVSEAARGAIGVWSAYGDSIPIESLTESITESARVAQVTGTLADAINWAERSNEDWTAAMKGHSAAQEAFNKAIAEGETQEDAYSAALAACADTQERAELIAQTLNQTYGQSKETYDDLSQSTLDLNESELKLKDAQADLASSVIPLKTQINDLKANALTALKPAVDKASGAMQDMIEDVDWEEFGDTAEDAMDTVVDAIEFCVDHGNELTSVLKGAGTAFIAYKSSALISAAATKTAAAAQKIFTEGSWAAEKAQNALNLAQKGSAWILLAGLIAGAGVALVSYVSNLVETAKAEDENAVATEALRQKYEELQQTIESNQKAREENVASAEAETLVAENLAGKLEELASKENKSNAEKQLMAGYVDKLNEIYPGLNAQYDAEADKLNMSTQEIRNYITASKDMIMAKAYQENMIAVAEDLAQAQMDLSEAEEQVAKNSEASTKAHQEVTAAQEAYNEAVKEGADNQNELADRLNEATMKAQSADETLQNSKDTLSDYQKEVDGLTEEMDAWGNKINESIDTEEFKKKVDDLVAKTREAGVEVPDALAQGIKDGKYALPQSVEEMTALVTYDSLLKKADKAGITVPENITKGIQSGQLQPSQAVAQMQSLINFDDLLSKSEAAGYDVPQYLQDQILAGSMKPEEAVQYMKDLITYEDMLQEASDAGVEVPEEIKNGVNSGQMKPADAMEQVKNLMIQAAESSAEMNQKGKEGTQSYASGANSEKGQAYNAGKNVASEGKRGTESVSAYASGQNLTQGFINGMGSLVNNVFRTAAGIAQTALNAIKQTGGEGSPWKTTIQSGEWAVEGLEIGMEKRSRSLNDTASATVYDMGHVMYKSMEETMAGLPKVMADSFEMAMPSAEKKMENRIGNLKSRLQEYIGSSTMGRTLSANLKYTAAQPSNPGKVTNNNSQIINFNQPVETPDQVARTLRMQNRYGLAGE